MIISDEVDEHQARRYLVQLPQQIQVGDVICVLIELVSPVHAGVHSQETLDFLQAVQRYRRWGFCAAGVGYELRNVGFGFNQKDGAPSTADSGLAGWSAPRSCATWSKRATTTWCCTPTTGVFRPLGCTCPWVSSRAWTERTCPKRWELIRAKLAAIS